MAENDDEAMKKGGERLLGFYQKIKAKEAMDLQVMVIPAGTIKKERCGAISRVQDRDKYRADIREQLRTKAHNQTRGGVSFYDDLANYTTDGTFSNQIGAEIQFRYPVVSWEEAMRIWDEFWSDAVNQDRCWERFEADLHQLARNDEEHDAIKRYCLKARMLEKLYALSGKDFYAE